MATRERNNRSQPFLAKLVEHSYQGLKTNQLEIIHGSLLTYRELLLHAGMVHLSLLLCVHFILIIVGYARVVL